MKATLEFNLPEEEREYRLANQATDIIAAVCQFDDKLRSYRKYGNDFKDVAEALEAVHQLLHQELNIRYINIYD